MRATTTRHQLRRIIPDLWGRLGSTDIALLCHEYERLCQHYTGFKYTAEQQDEYCTAAITAAARFLLGEISFDDVRRCVESARNTETKATAAAKAIAAMAYEQRKPTSKRISQTDAAEAVGINRGTLDTYRGVSR